MQAIILAAGMGKRLKDLTNDNTKCMIKVNGVTLIDRMLKQLDKCVLSNIIIVVGYKSEGLINFIATLKIKTPITCVVNEVYYKTNNIYSLFLAKEFLMNDDTILLESDLIFEDSVLNKIIMNPYPSLALVAKYESWMDGTVVTIDENNSIKSFLNKKEFQFQDIPSYYKTVNIYKFSKSFSTTHYVPFLEAYTKALGNNEYYEQVLKVITLLEKPEIKALVLDQQKWYEIDDVQDLEIAESIFTLSDNDKLIRFQNRFGGYWRYPDLINFCCLVNPFFPPQKLIDEIKANFERLVCNYPSGVNINNLLVAKYYGLHKDHIIVGNGAAELIKSVMQNLKGKVGIAIPTFEEYPNRIKEYNNLVPYFPKNKDYSYSSSDLINFYNANNVSTLILINPDNPSGNYINNADVLAMAEWAKMKGITFIVDESFIDFVDEEEQTSLLSEEILKRFPQLIVVKSISKSFGVPGLRLGVLATYDKNVVEFIKKDSSIWNINSFAEFYLQIFEKYKRDYQDALVLFKQVRRDFLSELSTIQSLRIIPSQANYFLCEVMDGMSATELTMKLLSTYNIFINDLSRKNGINGEYISITIKCSEENKRLIDAISNLLP